MFAPLKSATRTRQLVAEILVVVFLAALLVVAYRIDPEWISRHVTMLNVWPEQDARAWSFGARAVLLLLAALVALVLRPVLMFASRKASIAGLKRWTVPVLLATAASAVALELYIGWREASLQAMRTVYQRRGVDDPHYGWVWGTYSAATERIDGRDTHWAFNREGYRVRSQDDEPDPARPTILFTGESIVAGSGLDYAETFPALIAARRGVQCVNLAVNAYGSDQAYLRLIDAMPRFQRLVATVTVFIPVMLGRNLHDDKPRLVLGSTGDLEFVPPATGFLSDLQIRKLFWNRLPYIGDRAIDRTLTLTAAILRETSIRTRAHGATPLFLVPSIGPERTLDEHPEAWILRALFVQQGIPFILVDIPPDQMLEDHHPGPRGDETIAAAILAALPPGS